ncbi:type II secretion system F family protein [Rheinheimera sp.]|uniref:type II secretion system F family protein n=1 Tax=Rheinheimera sp. TaxID=1869214 RepID=UPI00307EAE34
MAWFDYKAYDQAGHLISSEIEGESVQAVHQLLQQQGLFPLSVKERKNQQRLSLFQSSQLSLNELEFITSELALLLRSGVKIDRSLAMLAKGKSDSLAGKLLTELSNSVKRGESLAEALSHHKHFDNLYVSLVRMGEASGELAEVFAGLARDLKFRKELQAKITQAMVYPAVIFSVCVLAIVFVFNYIVPQMSGLFEGNANLPWYTQMLISASKWMQSYQWYLALILVALAGGAKWAADRGLLSQWLDEYLIRVPVFKTAIMQIERIRFNTSMALMLDAGVRLDQAIELAANTIKNALLRQSVMLAKAKIKRGNNLTETLAATSLYPDFYLSLLEVGEESGQLGVVFDEIASRSRNDFTGWTTKMTSLLEPLMILVMGGIVGSVVVVMLLSIMSVNDGI